MDTAIIKSIIIILTVVVFALLIVNPGTQTQFVPTCAEINIGEPQLVVSAVRNQLITDVWNDSVVFSDDRTGNSDVWVYDDSANASVKYAGSIYDEGYGAISEYAIVYGKNYGYGYTPEGRFVSNLTTFHPNINHLLIATSPCEIYEQNFVYGRHTSKELWLNNVSTNVSTQIGEGIFEYPSVYAIWGDYIVVGDHITKTIYYYSISRDSITAVESTDSNTIQVAIYENYIFFRDYEASTASSTLKMHNINTGKTSVLVEDILGTRGIDAHDGWVTYMISGSPDYEIGAYNYIEEENIDLGAGYSPHIWDGNVYYSAVNGGNDYDIFKVKLTVVEASTPPTPETPEEALETFLADYGYIILGILAIIGVGLAIEGKKYQWKHLQSARGKTIIGLLISIGLIVVLVLLLVA